MDDGPPRLAEPGGGPVAGGGTTDPDRQREEGGGGHPGDDPNHIGPLEPEHGPPPSRVAGAGTEKPYLANTQASRPTPWGTRVVKGNGSTPPMPSDPRRRTRIREARLNGQRPARGRRRDRHGRHDPAAESDIDGVIGP